MDSTPDFPSNQSLGCTAQTIVVEPRTTCTRLTVVIMLWIIGFIAVVVSSITLWYIVLSLLGVVTRLRGRRATNWFVEAIFIWLGTIVMWTLFFLIDFIVGWPRPSSSLIHVYIPANSYTDGHSKGYQSGMKEDCCRKLNKTCKSEI